jgi:hypothetical protein
LRLAAHRYKPGSRFAPLRCRVVRVVMEDGVGHGRSPFGLVGRIYTHGRRQANLISVTSVTPPPRSATWTGRCCPRSRRGSWKPRASPWVSRRLPCCLSRWALALPPEYVHSKWVPAARDRLCLLSRRWSVRAAALTGRLRPPPTRRLRRPAPAGASVRSYASFGVHRTVDRHRRQR